MRQAVQKNPGRLNLGWVLFGGLAMLGTAGCVDGADGAGESDKHSSFSNKVVLDWGTQVRNVLAIETGNFDPLVGTRTLAMVHIAMHDAANAADRQYTTYSFDGRDSTAHPVAAAASAAHRVLVNLFPAHSAALDAQLTASLAAVPNGLSENRGVTLGQKVGDEILQLRADDGSSAVVGYEPGTGPGEYQFVPPFEGFIFRPEWQFVEPFGMESPDQFRIAPPPALNTTTYRDAYNEVKAIGILDGSTRSAAQSTIARFWYEDSDITWNAITRDVVIRRNLSLHSSARLFALVNIAMADSFIGGWDGKYHYDFWRPFTAIRAGADDGNSGTAPDANWVPFLDTPPVQDYPSTHSVVGEAAATVLGRVLGDRTTFSVTTSTAENPSLARTYSRFSTASDENSDSRVFAGIHFRFAVDKGQEMGEDIGNHTYDNFLRRLF
jgi:hypothetical protein